MEHPSVLHINTRSLLKIANGDKQFLKEFIYMFFESLNDFFSCTCLDKLAFGQIRMALHNLVPNSYYISSVLYRELKNLQLKVQKGHLKKEDVKIVRKKFAKLSSQVEGEAKKFLGKL